MQGGTPVRSTYLPYGRPEVTPEDRAAVDEVLGSQWLTTGPRVPALEAAFAKACGAAEAVAISSGTAALHAALHTLDLAPGDEVVTTPLTFAATANSVVYNRAKPVFADIDARTLNIDPAKVEAACGPRTRAIVAVHFAGLPVDVDRLAAIAQSRGIELVLDACHALGAQVGGRPVGGDGRLTAYSLHAVKHITGGEGGIITTNDAARAARMRRFRNHGISTDLRERQKTGSHRYDLEELGFNYRMSDIACALAKSQLGRLEENIARREALAARYDAALARFAELELPARTPNTRHAWHIYPVRLVSKRLTADRDTIHRALTAENIGVNVHYAPVHLFTYYRKHFGYGEGLCPVAEDASARILTLPLFHAMTDADVDDVVAALDKVLAHYR